MRSIIRRNRVPVRVPWLRLAIIIAPAVLVGLLCAFGAFNELDSRVYDMAMRTSAAYRSQPSEVLLVYRNDHRELGAPLITVIEELRRLGAGPIGILLPVDLDSAQAIHQRFPQVTFGNTLVNTSHSADTASVPVGNVDFRTPRHGVARTHYRWLDASGCGTDSLPSKVRDTTSSPTIEAVLAQQYFGENFRPRPNRETSKYRIWYRGRAESLPHVNTTSVTNGDLVASLVKQRCVLIGRAPNAADIRISTPTTAGGPGMTALEVHGHALNSLLLRRNVVPLHRGATFLVFLIAAVLGRILYRSSRVRLSVLCLVVVTSAVGGTAWVLLHWLQVWIPCVPLAAIQIICWVADLHRKLRANSSTLHRVLRAKLERLKSVVNRRDSSAEPWADISELVDQLVEADRFVLLSLPRGSDHLRVMQTVNCTAADICERRRDQRRVPFSTAIDANGPVENTKRPFFDATDAANASEYLIPLARGGQTHGFAVLQFSNVKIANDPQFSHRLQQLADAIIHRAAAAQEHRRPKTSEHKPSWNPFANHELNFESEINAAEHRLERHQTLIDHIFANSANASAICDVFGQAVQLNSAMQSVVRTASGDQLVLADDLNALQILVLLTGEETTVWRDRLRRVFLDRESHKSILVGSQHGAGGNGGTGVPFTRVLYVKPIIQKRETTAKHEILGVQIELVDATDISQAERARSKMVVDRAESVQRQLNSIKQSLPSGDQNSILGEQLQSCIQAIEHSLDAATRPLSCQADDVLPVDAIAMLTTALDASRHERDLRGIQINLTEHPTSHETHHKGETNINRQLVVANPVLLQSALESVIDILTDNSREESTVHITCDLAGDFLMIRCTNDGFGTPQGRLAECFSRDAVSDLDAFRDLRKMRDCLRAWGGRLTAGSEAGSGIVLELLLRTYDPQSSENSTISTQVFTGELPIVPTPNSRSEERP